jgi:hypothetical protein
MVLFFNNELSVNKRRAAAKGTETPVAFHPKAWLMKRFTGRSSGLLLLNPSHHFFATVVCASAIVYVAV